MKRILLVCLALGIAPFAAVSELPPEMAAIKWVEQDVHAMVVNYPERWQPQRPPLKNRVTVALLAGAGIDLVPKPGTPEKILHAVDSAGSSELTVTVNRPIIENTPEAKSTYMGAASKVTSPDTETLFSELAKIGKHTGLLTIGEGAGSREGSNIRRMSFSVFHDMDLYSIVLQCDALEFEANAPVFSTILQNFSFR